MADADRCVMCGKIIPEGYGMTCYDCNKPRVNLYDTVRNKLIDFERTKDKETTDTDWLLEFHSLLVRIQNAFECGDIKA